MLYKRSLYLLVLTIILFCCFSCSGEDKPRTLKLSIILGENSDWYRGADKFRELLEKRTEGKYRIKIFTHSQLAGQVQRTELEMLQTGVIDMSLESSILLSLVEPSMALPSLPWLFRDYRNAFRVLDGSQGDMLLEKLKDKKIVGLAYGANGFRQLTNSKRPVLLPEDIKAMKIRVPSISLYIDIFRMLGADPSPMNFGELFTALAQGAMDGQENPISVIYSARINEVQKYLTVWNYSYDPVILCINKKLWDSFSEDLQGIFKDCAKEAMKYEREMVAGQEASLIDSLRSRGMIISFPDIGAISEFRKLAEPVYRKCAGNCGENILKAFIIAAEDTIAEKR